MRTARDILDSPTWDLLDGRIIGADCIEAMAMIPDASIDSIVCDPPYGLEFMGKDWDAPWKIGERGDEAAFVKTGYSDGAQRLSRPTFTGNPNTSCLNCGGSRRGRESEKGPKRCRCDAPRFPNIAAIQGRAYQSWCEAWATEALRVLKPGGHLLAFGGTRTYHRLAAGIEDAGFEIRDSIMWLYGSGFPKSHDVSKAIDKAAGAEREVVGHKESAGYPDGDGTAMYANRAKSDGSQVATEGMPEITAPATPEAAEWEGWGTALKPAHEPVVVARKPLIGTVATNVLTLGTGAINVDGCRIEGASPSAERRKGAIAHLSSRPAAESVAEGLLESRQSEEAYRAERPGEQVGRWPANVVLCHAADCVLVGKGFAEGRAEREAS